MSENAEEHANRLVEFCLKARETVDLHNPELDKADDETEKDEYGCVVGKEVWNEEIKKCVPKPESEEKANPFEAAIKAFETAKAEADNSLLLEDYQKSVLKDLKNP